MEVPILLAEAAPEHLVGRGGVGHGQVSSEGGMRARVVEAGHAVPGGISSGDLPLPRWQNTSPSVMKVYLLGANEREIRRFTMEEATFEALESNIRRYFQISDGYDLVLKYKDCENELVTFSSTHEMQLGFQFRKHNQMKIYAEKRRKKSSRTGSSVSTKTKSKHSSRRKEETPDGSGDKRDKSPEGPKRRKEKTEALSSGSSSSSDSPAHTPSALGTQLEAQVELAALLESVRQLRPLDSSPPPTANDGNASSSSANQQPRRNQIRRQGPMYASSPDVSPSSSASGFHPQMQLQSMPLPAQHLASAQAFINRYFQGQGGN